MWRLVASLFLAILVHALLLSWSGPLKRAPVLPISLPQTRMVTMTLFQSEPKGPARSAETPSPPKEKMAEKEVAPKEKPPKPTDRPKPKRKLPDAPQPTAKKVPLAEPPMPEKEPSNEKETAGGNKENSHASQSAFQGDSLSGTPPATGAGRGPGIGELITEASPIYKENPPPPYPKSARRRGYSGTVLLEVLVTVKGGVREIRIIESSGYPMLDTAALKAVKTWAFVPGKKGTTPIEMRVNVPVIFKLEL